MNASTMTTVNTVVIFASVSVLSSGAAAQVDCDRRPAGAAGIAVIENSEVFIGFVNSSDTVASPNIITGNGAQGIAVFRGAYARIAGNDISFNRANGVNVRESASAHISDNILNGNGQNGILVAQGSGVTLGMEPVPRSSREPTQQRSTIWALESGVRLEALPMVDWVASMGIADPRRILRAAFPV
jgi:parallel beta-helix repeat protein